MIRSMLVNIGVCNCNLIFATTVCYNLEDKGDFYNGTINVTVSGRVCQKWDSNTPHVHPLTSLYRLYLESHNYCRNPEGRGMRPWCYTTDSNQRWEYCDVDPCRASESNSSDDEFPLVTVLAIIVPVLFGILLMLLIVILIFRHKEKARSAKLNTVGKIICDALSESIIICIFDCSNNDVNFLNNTLQFSKRISPLQFT